MAKAKDKDDPFRLMGFGHRVYKNRPLDSAKARHAVDKPYNTMNSQYFDRALKTTSGVSPELLVHVILILHDITTFDLHCAVRWWEQSTKHGHCRRLPSTIFTK